VKNFSHISLNDIFKETNMTDIESVRESDLSELYVLKKQLEQTISDAQQKVKIIKDVLESRYLERAQNKLRQDGKDFGSVVLQDKDFRIKINIRKKVEWDPDKTISVLNNMDEDTARHYATVKYTIPEAKFNNAPPDIKAVLSEARTVHLQGISVDLEREEDA
tara:strand:- start:2715 stop:3203 length:489 start_codon:yes stop_codon:yes gene_type:complete